MLVAVEATVPGAMDAFALREIYAVPRAARSPRRPPTIATANRWQCAIED